MPSIATLVNWIQRGLDISPAQAEKAAANIVPTLSIGDVSHWSRNNSRVVRPASGWYTKAAVAGNYAHIGLINPATSGAYLIVESLWFNNTAAGAYTYELVSTTETAFKALTGAATGFLTSYRDFRGIETAMVPSGTKERTIGEFWAGHQSAPVDGFRGGRYSLAPAPNVPPVQHYGEWLLSPGTCLAIVQTTANAEISTVWAYWREEQIPR